MAQALTVNHIKALTQRFKLPAMPSSVVGYVLLLIPALFIQAERFQVVRYKYLRKIAPRRSRHQQVQPATGHALLPRASLSKSPLSDPVSHGVWLSAKVLLAIWAS